MEIGIFIYWLTCVVLTSLRLIVQKELAVNTVMNFIEAAFIVLLLSWIIVPLNIIFREDS